jgi:hypothetical protein
MQDTLHQVGFSWLGSIDQLSSCPIVTLNSSIMRHSDGLIQVIVPSDTVTFGDRHSDFMFYLDVTVHFIAFAQPCTTMFKFQGSKSSSAALHCSLFNICLFWGCTGIHGF